MTLAVIVTIIVLSVIALIFQELTIRSQKRLISVLEQRNRNQADTIQLLSDLVTKARHDARREAGREIADSVSARLERWKYAALFMQRERDKLLDEVLRLKAKPQHSEN